jgi:hypothetical protein
VRGHPRAGGAVENGVTIPHHPDEQLPFLTRRPPRCFRHVVQMAACEDCRAAFSAQLASRRERAAEGR